MNTTSRTVRYETAVTELSDAWAFIMGRLDELGPEPSIHITPVWIEDVDAEEAVNGFFVSVEGTVTEEVE